MTDLSRRSVVSASALAAVMATFGPASKAVAGAAKARAYTRARFVRQHRKMFRFTSPTGSWPMRLSEVSDLSASSRGSERAFALTFRSTRPGPPQGTYLLRRRRFGSTQLFIVPSDDSRRTYHVVING